MAKKKEIAYVCDSCGYDSVNWQGKCPGCGEWNSFREIKLDARPGGARAADRMPNHSDESRVQRLDEIVLDEKARISLGSAEIDRVMGGGVFPHTTVLLAGEPGIGKSTMLLHVAAHIATEFNKKTVYIAAEESAEQIKARADRLGIDSEHIFILAEQNMDTILSALARIKPVCVIVDSIQAVFSPSIPSVPGTVTQVRDSALLISQSAKEHGFVAFFVGHVTKEGVLAGPRTLEHLVDVVMYFEGDRYQPVRMIRSVKNRYGATGEIGMFEMTAAGLAEITNPSKLFLPDDEEVCSGRVITSVIEGKRPFFVEVQALTNETSFNNPIRRAVGVEVNKVSLLLAVVERALGISLVRHDVFVKVVGGMSVKEPSVDLAIALAVLSSFKDLPVSPRMVVMGELGLGGEVRKVPHAEYRIKEAERLGFERLIVPKRTKLTEVKKIKVSEIGHVRELEAMI